MNCDIGTDIERAAALIRDGGLVAFATETVYGLGADALNPKAVARIFEAKQRPLYDPLICHVSDRSMVEMLTAADGTAATGLMDAFWPGPLSIVVPRTEGVSDLVTAGLENVAVRMPAHDVARKLIASAGTPIAAPSANLFGQVSPTTAAHVADQLGDRVDYILDGGACAVGVESTVVQVDGETVEVLRPGGVTLEQLRQVVATVELVQSAENPVLKGARAPGMLPRHYAPRTPITIVEKLDGVEWRRGDVLLTAGPVTLPDPQSGPNSVVVLSDTGDLRECAAGFFAALRSIDSEKADRIVALPFPDHGLGLALNDRLKRAAD